MTCYQTCPADNESHCQPLAVCSLSSEGWMDKTDESFEAKRPKECVSWSGIVLLASLRRSKGRCATLSVLAVVQEEWGFCSGAKPFLLWATGSCDHAEVWGPETNLSCFCLPAYRVFCWFPGRAGVAGVLGAREEQLPHGAESGEWSHTSETCTLLFPCEGFVFIIQLLRWSPWYFLEYI